MNRQTLNFTYGFELAVHELKQIGLRLTCLPGEYRVNYRHGSETTARFAENLEDAVREGYDLIEKAPEKMRAAPLTRHSHPLTLKAIRRCQLLSHNHRARTIWLKKHHKK